VLVVQGIFVGFGDPPRLFPWSEKTFSVTIGCYLANLPARTSFYAGAAMVAIGEVSFHPGKFRRAGRGDLGEL